jgi:hypothetical protein
VRTRSSYRVGFYLSAHKEHPWTWPYVNNWLNGCQEGLFTEIKPSWHKI